jgi:hypothetical protein
MHTQEQLVIPVVVDHDHTRPVGALTIEDGKLIITLAKPLQRAAFFRTFGNVGAEVLEGDEIDGTLWFRKARVVVFSLDAADAGDAPKGANVMRGDVYIAS